MSGRLETTEWFIKRAKQIHGDKYNYSLVNYKGFFTKVILICHTCSYEFEQYPCNHIKGCGCPKCGGSFRLSTREFIERSKQVHRDKYDYSKVHYVNNKTKVIIICKTCHIHFEQLPKTHMRGSGCKICGHREAVRKSAMTTEKFIQKASKIHESKYSYHKTQYETAHGKVIIFCRICKRYFEQNAAHHLQGHGCNRCIKSLSEESIAEFLAQLNINYQREKRFKKCKLKMSLPFDFYFSIEEKHFLVEYDGLQHFEPIEHWGGEKGFLLTQKKDSIKNRFAKEYGYILIRVPYFVKNIKAYLELEIEKHISFSLRQMEGRKHDVTRNKIKIINPYHYSQGVLIH